MILKSAALLSLITGLSLATAHARTWTDTTGRKIEADIVRVEGEQVVLQFKGKEVKLALSKLSEDDRKFVVEWKETAPETPAAAPAGALTLCGTALTAGGTVTTVQEPLSAATLKKFAKADAKPTQLKIAIALPAGFDPAKPQHVMWVSAPINNEGERKSGNIGAMGGYAEAATQAGWVIIAADTDQGNARLEDNQRSEGGDLAVHKQAIEALVKAWPAAKTWKYACCGFSGGAKASFYRVGQLLDSDLAVTGLFLGGCNQDLTNSAREESGLRKSGLKKIRVYISNGKTDDISTVAHATSVKDSVEAQGYGEAKLEVFEGGHSMNRENFVSAMAWFKEAPAK
ncbi:SHD1 domain-containing protein [Luteolibacter flavescens]|uniref:SHD1 domain-containing protein n=1 Tax=Luteolibacter flavescens TaxID=1859460 RepID=A0ABT3FLU6_9BACT|nr:SHD1 domain-containing protein [Luteolibacter flavescens]MCW1884164.1 SHD1 domain-containing protein [Luteolibacter flavescens]